MNPLNIYLEVTVLLSCTAITLYILNTSVQRSWIKIQFQEVLKISKFLILVSFLLPLAMSFVPKEPFQNSHSQVFSSGQTRSVVAPTLISIPKINLAPADHNFTSALWMIFIIGCAFKLAVFLWRMNRLHSLFNRALVVKEIGQVVILTTPETSSPFSYGSVGLSRVVVPMDFWERTQDLKIALRHEFQHIRNGDTRFIFWLEFLSAAFYWNPFFYLLISQLNLVQEFACDEYLIGHQKVSPQSYGSCLLRAAESAHTALLVGATHMARGRSSALKRRIQMLFQTHARSSRFKTFLLSASLLGLMSSLAYATQSAVQTPSLTMAEARIFAEKTAKTTQIPIDMNELVLKRLNYFIGTSHGRSWVKNGLKRMKTYQPMIDAKTASLGLPEELIAIPLFESGFEKSVVSSHQAAGIWQFMAATAVNYDLQVDSTIDERLNPEKETRAAMRYFSYLKSDFHDWRLAIKAYNEGERQVHRMMEQLGTRDPWVIEHAESKEDYLSGAIAMMILVRNPELLN